MSGDQNQHCDDADQDQERSLRTVGNYHSWFHVKINVQSLQLVAARLTQICLNMGKKVRVFVVGSW